MPFFGNCITYLVGLILSVRLKISTHTIDAIRGIQHDATVPELLSSLGLCTFSCSSVPNFISVVTPMNNKLRERQRQTFDGLAHDKRTVLDL